MDAIIDSIGEFFRTQEKPDFSIQMSRYRRNATGIIQDESEKANPGDIIRIYAIGGDEILFDCLNGAALFPNTQLAIIPYGRINDFLRIFGERNIEGFKDIPSIINGEILPTDAIRWGINYALNSCYIGINPAASKKTTSSQSTIARKGISAFKKLSTFFSFIKMAFDKQIAARKYEIIIDGVDYSGTYSLIHAANGPYFAGKITGLNEAIPDDGYLDVALIKSSHPLTTMFSIKKYSKGKQPKNSVFVQGKTITVKSDSQMWIQLDNEFISDTNITMSLIPQAINMVVLNNLSYPIASISAL